LVDTIRKEVDTLNKNNIKLHVIGNMKMMPEYAQAEMNEAIEMTSQNTGLNLIMALSYSSRWELQNAFQNMAIDVKAGKLSPEEISADTIEKYLCTQNIPDPELMIRTSGEYRISNFLLYQLAYSELYFTNTRWPDFRKKNLYEAILDFQRRERRFGKISEQVKDQPQTV
jgi:undecaprenyl diphosphate synthase